VIATAAAGSGRLAGRISPRAERLVSEWLALHRDELQWNWDRARAAEPLMLIEPLP
jgi:uncharacterized protein DUF4160